MRLRWRSARVPPASLPVGISNANHGQGCPCYRAGPPATPTGMRGARIFARSPAFRRSCSRPPRRVNAGHRTALRPASAGGAGAMAPPLPKDATLSGLGRLAGVDSRGSPSCLGATPGCGTESRWDSMQDWRRLPPRGRKPATCPAPIHEEPKIQHSTLGDAVARRRSNRPAASRPPMRRLESSGTGVQLRLTTLPGV